MHRSRIVATNSSTDSPSPTPTTAIAQRRGNRRTRSGCMTCKIRKIKCDETRPYCLRCLRTGRECDGYPVTPQPLNRALLIQTHPSFESQAEARAFDFYLKRSSAALSGDMDTELWSRMVVQLSIREPAVKHAALAISSLHRRFDVITHREDRRRKQGLDVDERFALAQYGKAMQALRTWTPTGDQDAATIPLILCLLFVAVEFPRGDQESAQLHICQGRKMLAELSEEDLSPHVFDLLKRYLAPMYRRLGLACYLFSTVPAPMPSHFRNSNSNNTAGGGGGLGELSGFTSIEQARDEFYNMLDEVLQFVNVAQYAAYSATPPDRGPMDVEEEMPRLMAHQRDLLARLEQWNVAFATLCVTLPPMALPPTTMHLLRIYYHAAKTWIATALMPSELAFDEHLQSFSAIVTSSVVVIDAMGKQQQQQSPHAESAFSFETEVIAPLYWTCTKCRHPALRRAALQLLQREEMRTRKENLWSAEAMGAVSAYLISLEEEEEEEERQEEDAARLQAGDVTGAGGGSLETVSEDRVFTPPFSAADGSMKEADMVTATLPSAVESLIDRLLRVPTWYPPTIPGHPNLKLLKTLAEKPPPSPPPSLHPSTGPSTPGSSIDSTLSELVEESMKASYLVANTTPSPSPPPSPPPGVTTSPSPASTTRTCHLQDAPTPSPLAPSFGIPESMRVKNIIVGPTSDEGVWVTTFRDPPAGKGEWDVKRKYIPL